MSKFQEEVRDAIIKGSNLQSTDYKEEFYIGRYLSGWKHDPTTEDKRVGHRHADLQIKKNTIYCVSRQVWVEANGEYHRNPKNKWNDPEFDKNGKLIWTREQKFNDTVARDKWESIIAQDEKHKAILIRVEEPDGFGTEAYQEKRKALIEKLSRPGYFTGLIQDAEKKHAKGYLITWDDQKIVGTKQWKTPKFV